MPPLFEVDTEGSIAPMDLSNEFDWDQGEDSPSTGAENIQTSLSDARVLKADSSLHGGNAKGKKRRRWGGDITDEDMYDDTVVRSHISSPLQLSLDRSFLGTDRQKILHTKCFLYLLMIRRVNHGAFYTGTPSSISAQALLTKQHIEIESHYDVGPFSDIWQGRWSDKSQTQEVSPLVNSPTRNALLTFSWFL